MTNKEITDIYRLIDQIEASRIYAGALFEKYANDKDYDKGLLFYMIRETLRTTRKTLDSFLGVYKNDD